MFKTAPALHGLAISVALLASTAGTAQEVACRPLSDDEALKFISEPRQLLVKGSAVECKVGQMLILIRFQIVEYTARYDCEIRVKGEKPHCFRAS
jgi:hypothetical protein